jgi:Carboxypeptidase regulatory-like domain/TonB dependent receptor/TonB-dependent Receptor Plug Domain
MSRFSVRPLFFLSLVICVAVLFALASPACAQTSSTGALTGTVTDPSGGVISGATVTATNKATGQQRETKTDASGTYSFSLMSPGEYSVRFAASGFKTAEVPSVAVNITETHVFNHKMEVGAQSTEVTVEATVESIQTQSATVGSLVGSKEVTDLPLSSRNYTNIIDLSPGVVVNVASAAAVGNGTQDINVNGNGSDQNNYLMDGATLTNYGSGGAAQSGNFPGIAIPNPDSIQEFRIQTAQYDAEFGRNPGASVNVTTRDGTNQFHGAAWEFFRNTALDANDFFNRISQAELQQPNKPQTLNENMFGGTIGGPIKKDKLFFFASYQGFRQKNAIGTNGFATGLSTGMSLYPFTAPGANGGRSNNVSGTIPLDYIATNAPCSYATYRQYLGCAFGGTAILPFLPFGTHVPVATNGSNINQTAINILQFAGPKGGLNQGFYIPSVPYGSNGLPITSSTLITDALPTQANENQYLGNIEYVLNSKNTFYQKFFYSGDPQVQSFVCLDGIGNLVNSCAPGAPEDVRYTSLNETMKFTTVATSNLVNDVLFSFVRTTTVANPGTYISACSVGITPPLANGNCGSIPSSNNINPIPLQIPTISFLGIPMNVPVGYADGALNTGGNFFASATNYFNTFQGSDNLSWTHGKQTIRTGFYVMRLQYNWTLPGRGGLDFPTVSDFLTSSSGAADTMTAPAPNGILVNFYGLPPANGNKHDQRANQFAAYVEDDIKVSPKLTLNLGLRWEYDGYPTDNTGLFTNAWQSQAGINNTGSFFLGNQASAANCPSFPCPFKSNQIGTLAGYVVQSNYNPNVAGCGNPLAPSACGLSAPAGIFPGYPGGATGVYRNTNLTLVHGAPIDDFAPRIGVAWQPLSPNFVIRAGYGIFYDAVYANLLANNNAGNTPYNGYVNAGFPGNALDLPIVPNVATGGILGWTPRTLQVLQGTPATGATVIMDNSGGLGLGDTQIYQFIGIPLIQQYNLDLQYALGRNWVLDVGYVGAHGTHLYDWAHTPNYANLAPNAPNEPAPNDIQDRMMVIGSGFQGTPNSFAWNDAANTNPASQILVNTGASAALPGNALGRVPWLGFSTTGLSQTTTEGDSLYNSLQINLKHQWSRGLLIQAAYTWSKLITNINSPEAGGGIAAPGNVLSGGASSNDPLNFAQQYGLAAFNRSQRFVIAYSYDLPYKNTEGVVGHLLSGWTVSGVTTVQNGQPFTVIDGNGGTIFSPAGAGFGGGGVRAELNPASTGKCNAYGVCQGIALASSGSSGARVLNGLSGLPCANGWINVQAFGTCTGLGGTFAATGTPCIGGTIQGDCLGSGGGRGFGNSAVGSILGPGQFNWDISLIKNTKVTEAVTLQFRTEWYNVWNHAQFNPPVNNVADTTFGQVQNSSVPPRIMQFALKLLF